MALESGIMASMSDVNGRPGPQSSVSEDGDSAGSASWSESAGSGGSPGGKRLERKVAGRWVAGVCAGLADYTGIDATLIRVIFAVATFFGGLGPIAYVLGWALIPEQGESASIAERFINKPGT
jgi:phage shock protein PspC (stress-responsive transcriptional regulator)